jgi:starch-binding outer membrane protein, SusD/RagB family
MTLNSAMTRRLLLRALAPAAVLAALGTAACKDVTNLDETASTFISPDKFFQNDAQAQTAVNGTYAPLMSWNGWKQPAQHSIMCDDNEMLCWNWMGGGFSGQWAGQWYNQDNSTWFGDYQMVERANVVIEKVAASSGISDAQKKISTGQALFARAYAYFDLVRRFGGVPIRTKSYVPDESLGKQARSPADSVWLQIAADLREAAPLLPASYTQPNGKGLPTKAAAWGLLAKVYLHMAGEEVKGTPLAALRTQYLDSARLAALEVMNDGTVRLEANYKDLFDVAKQNTSPEILFAVQGAKVNLNGSNIPPFTIPQGDCTLVGGCGSGFLTVREDFYRSFDPADKRVEPNVMIARAWEYTNSAVGKVRVLSQDSLNTLFAANLVAEDKQFRWEAWTEGCGAFGTRFDTLTLRTAPGAATTLPKQVIGVARPIYMLKYVDRGAAGSSEYANSNNFAIVRFADVLLVYAEAVNERSGPTAEAHAALNQVRARAGLPALSLADPAAFRQAVWTERAHELYGEFQGRFDLIREGRYLTVMNQNTTIADLRPNSGICRPRQEFQELMNIPQRELAANPLMTQNPGY